MNPIRAWIARQIPGGPFARNVVKIASGAVLGQGVTVLAMPLLSRIYLPEHFGLQAIYTSILGMLMVVATLRFEMAIALPQEHADGAKVLALSLVSALLVSVLVLVLSVTLGEFFLRRVHAEGLRPYFWWVVPLGVLGAGFYQSLSYWALRVRDYDRVGKTRLTQGWLQVLAQIALAPLPGPTGLFLGAEIARFGGVGNLGRSAWAQERATFKSVRLSDLWGLARRYRAFPLVSAGSALLNALGLSLTPILIAAFFGPAVAGQLSISLRMMAVPTLLIGQAIAQVYTAEGAALIRERPGELHALVARTIRRLFWVGLGPAIVIGCFGPWAVKWLLGPQWAQAGVFARYLAPMFVIQFIASPMASTLVLLERQDLQLIWDISRLVGVVGTLLVGARLGMTPEWAIAVFAFTMGGMYLIQLYLVHMASGRLARETRGT